MRFRRFLLNIEIYTHMLIDGESPTTPPKPLWYKRASPAFLIAIIFIPLLVCGGNYSCHKVLPGEKLSLDELLLPSVGVPLALVLAVLSLRASSWRRRIALLAIIALCLYACVATVQRVVAHR